WHLTYILTHLFCRLFVLTGKNSRFFWRFDRVLFGHCDGSRSRKPCCTAAYTIDHDECSFIITDVFHEPVYGLPGRRILVFMICQFITHWLGNLLHICFISIHIFQRSLSCICFQTLPSASSPCSILAIAISICSLTSYWLSF